MVLEQERKLLLEFLKFMASQHGAEFCTSEYAGEMMIMGPKDEYIDEFLERRRLTNSGNRITPPKPNAMPD